MGDLKDEGRQTEEGMLALLTRKFNDFFLKFLSEAFIHFFYKITQTAEEYLSAKGIDSTQNWARPPVTHSPAENQL